MKILLVSPYLPHPLSGHGTGAFMYGLLTKIAPRHEVTLVSFCDKRELGLAGDLRALPIRLHAVPRGKGGQANVWWNLYLAATRALQSLRSVLLWQPYYVAKFYHPRMARLIGRITAESSHDIVQLEMVQMAQYAGSAASGKQILQAHDVAFRPAYRRFRSAGSLPGKILSFVEWCRWAMYERRMTGKFDGVICVTEQDKMLLERLTSSTNISYLPRGVDVAEEFPPYSGRESESLLFVGTFSHRPNTEAALWLAGEIFPLVLQKFPRAVLSIIGSNPPRELQELAARMPQIRILGFVDDIGSHFRTSSVFAAPLRSGGGVKVKILHAMGQGIPVVTTSVGIEGIEGMTPETALIGESAERLAGHICGLFADRERAAAAGRLGWQAMRSYYSWDRVVERLEGIYKRAIES
ncbi:MAG TPA: glycosyltransferase family 4 protein [Bacteroidota bacterium]